MNRSWVRFPQAAQIRPPGSGWAFLYARVVLLCGPTGVPGAGGPDSLGRALCVPVGGGPPASRPRRELRSARRLEARPSPAAAHGHRSLALRSLRRPSHQWGLVANVARCVGSKPGQALLPPINFACNSPTTASRFEFRSLELQRLQPLLKPLPIELHASFLGSGLVATCGCRSQAL